MTAQVPPSLRMAGASACKIRKSRLPSAREGRATAKPGGSLSAWQSVPGFRCAQPGPQCQPGRVSPAKGADAEAAHPPRNRRTATTIRPPAERGEVERRKRMTARRSTGLHRFEPVGGTFPEAASGIPILMNSAGSGIPSRHRYRKQHAMRRSRPHPGAAPEQNPVCQRFLSAPRCPYGPGAGRRATILMILSAGDQITVRPGRRLEIGRLCVRPMPDLAAGASRRRMGERSETRQRRPRMLPRPQAAR